MCKNTIIGKENKECEYYYASRHIHSNTSRRFKIFEEIFFYSFVDERQLLFQKISSKSILKIDTRAVIVAFYSSLVLEEEEEEEGFVGVLQKRFFRR